MDLDTVIYILSQTIFSPLVCIVLSSWLPLQGRSTSHPVFVYACIWTGLICFVGLLHHVDRIYTNGGNWFRGPSKLIWGKQVVLITGGGTGIGAHLAETLALRNVQVVVLTKDPPRFESEHQRIHSYICDVSDRGQLMRLVERIGEEVGSPTIVVNNAGVVKGKLLLDLSENDIRDTFGANTLAQFWVLQAFLPAMLREGKGHIVTIASILGVVGTAQMTDYCASKAALVSLHQSLRAELDTRYETPSIRTSLVLPSFISTSLFSRINLPQYRLWTFLAPSVQPHTVVKHIIDALDAQESRTIRLPWYSNGARFMGAGVGVCPKWLGDLLQYVAGANHSMKEYGPHPDAGERLRSERRLKRDTKGQ